MVWRLSRRELAMKQSECGLDSPYAGALTGPELVFVLEVISNFVFHTMNSFISSLGSLVIRGKDRAGSGRSL